MIKRLLALLMIFVMCFGTVTAFAKMDSYYSLEQMEENEIKKTVQNFGDIKIISWESGNEVIVEQYDSNGAWVETNIGNRITKDIEVKTATKTYTTSAEDVVTLVSERDLSAPVTFSSNKVGTIKASNLLTNTKKTMYLYEEVGTGKQSTHTVGKYKGTLANFIASMAIGLGVSEEIAGKMAGAFTAAGIGIIVGKLIEITMTVNLAAIAYPHNYYGKDSASGKKSTTYQKAGYKYIINDEVHVAFMNKTYYDKLVYNKIDSDTDYKLGVMIVRNLYGVDYDIY